MFPVAVHVPAIVCSRYVVYGLYDVFTVRVRGKGHGEQRSLGQPNRSI